MVVESTKKKINKEISLRRINKTYCPLAVASTLPNHAVILFFFAFGPGLGGVHLLAANWDLE
jgi:hypothetical protein